LTLQALAPPAFLAGSHPFFWYAAKSILAFAEQGIFSFLAANIASISMDLS